MARRLEKTTKLTEILHQGSLAAFAHTAQQLARLDEILGLYLDTHLRNLVQVASYKEGILTLATGNSAAAGQLRYLSRIHVQRLRQHDEFCGLSRIKVVSAPAKRETCSPGEPPPPALPRLSPATGTLLMALAESLRGEEVSEALRRLASHTGTNGQSRG